MPAAPSQCFAPFRLRSLARLSSVLLALSFVGCSSADPLVPVYGLVLIDGQPLSGASVTFYPAAGGVSSVAVTDISGRFTLRTQDGRPGALAGAHQVAVLHPEDLSRTPSGVTPALRNASYSEPLEESEPIVPQKYTRLSTSGLTVEVKHRAMEPVYLKLNHDAPELSANSVQRADTTSIGLITDY